jgi:hypothetical protein
MQTLTQYLENKLAERSIADEVRGYRQAILDINEYLESIGYVTDGVIRGGTNAN